jgi:hypothetical protein
MIKTVFVRVTGLRKPRKTQWMTGMAVPSLVKLKSKFMDGPSDLYLAI